MINFIFEPWREILKKTYKVVLDIYLILELMRGCHPIYKKFL